MVSEGGHCDHQALDTIKAATYAVPGHCKSHLSCRNWTLGRPVDRRCWRLRTQLLIDTPFTLRGQLSKHAGPGGNTLLLQRLDSALYPQSAASFPLAKENTFQRAHLHFPRAGTEGWIWNSEAVCWKLARIKWEEKVPVVLWL